MKREEHRTHRAGRRGRAARLQLGGQRPRAREHHRTRRGAGHRADLFFFQAEDGIRDGTVTGVQTCALPIFTASGSRCCAHWFLSRIANDDRYHNAHPRGGLARPHRSEERRVGKECRSWRWTCNEKGRASNASSRTSWTRCAPTTRRSTSASSRTPSNAPWCWPPGRSFFFSSRRRHTRWNCDWSSDVCSSDLHCIRLSMLCSLVPLTYCQ